MAFEFQPSVLPNHPRHSSSAQAHGRQRPQLAIPTGDNDRPGASQTSPISVKLEEMFAHGCFHHYSSTIQDMFEADHQHWFILRFLRRDSQCPLFRRNHTSIYYNPPPDLFALVAEIREDKSWEAKRLEVLASDLLGPILEAQGPVRTMQPILHLPRDPFARHREKGSPWSLLASNTVGRYPDINPRAKALAPPLPQLVRLPPKAMPV
ncbi:hypothetical protein G647_06075 [Cladophialophora carrionii CBS 160.54]|uniref:Uncharacterized protein n=1 Tax=Cladophialophora carrionii CBS 160.54 TaxID=1279043 RepID=V9D558_9EURO|nr:uncharacterized protein G647_06075 [Cladophialophora carrionii CBS 160.54]ETI22005.1 hypothetical protein G647_06075 [Cladophialophora carrionii CBS 160.54]